MATLPDTVLSTSGLTPELLVAAGFRLCPAMPDFQGTMFVRELPVGITCVRLPQHDTDPMEIYVGPWHAPVHYFRGLAMSLPQLLRWLT